MLDEQSSRMLDAAAGLTGEDLDYLRGFAPAATAITPEEVPDARAGDEEAADATVGAEPWDGHEAVADGNATPRRPARARSAAKPKHASRSAAPRGEYERLRTRESKVSTECLGRERQRHDWWPVGTELVGSIGGETFTAVVMENLQVKSGRSLLITSGPASGKVCITPTRAAIEATEPYRQARNWGRAGVTNGWLFWQPKT